MKSRPRYERRLLFKMQIGNEKKVFVATYTNEGLKFQMVLGPL